jgi:hypothetical protein
MRLNSCLSQRFEKTFVKTQKKKYKTLFFILYLAKKFKFLSINVKEIKYTEDSEHPEYNWFLSNVSTKNDNNNQNELDNLDSSSYSWQSENDNDSM